MRHSSHTRVHYRYSTTQRAYPRVTVSFRIRVQCCRHPPGQSRDGLKVLGLRKILARAANYDQRSNSSERKHVHILTLHASYRDPTHARTFRALAHLGRWYRCVFVCSCFSTSNNAIHSSALPRACRSRPPQRTRHAFESILQAAFRRGRRCRSRSSAPPDNHVDRELNRELLHQRHPRANRPGWRPTHLGRQQRQDPGSPRHAPRRLR